MFCWKSATPSVPNNRQSKIHKIAHKSNERSTITSTAHPAGNRSQAPIAVAVSIRSIVRTFPRLALPHGRRSSTFRRTTRLTLISPSCWRACARS